MNPGLRTALVAVGLGLTATAGRAANRAKSTDVHAQMTMPEPSVASLEQRCRTGAFTEAASIVNSTVEIARGLPTNTPKGIRAELDTVLDTALRQANSEVHCVAGGLQFGYEKSYADVIRRSLDLARVRGLPKSLIETTNLTVKILERNQPVTASTSR